MHQLIKNVEVFLKIFSINFSATFASSGMSFDLIKVRCFVEFSWTQAAFHFLASIISKFISRIGCIAWIGQLLFNEQIIFRPNPFLDKWKCLLKNQNIYF